MDPENNKAPKLKKCDGLLSDGLGGNAIAGSVGCDEAEGSEGAR